MTFTDRIRTAAKALAPGTFTKRDLSVKAEIKTREDDRRIGYVIHDMRKSGEIQSVTRGVYMYMGKAKKKKQTKDVMWRALRAMRNMTVEDLREMSGAGEGYAKEWLWMLKRRGVVAERNGRYRLINDTGPNGMPENEEKAEKLRVLRLKKKEAALAALARAEAAIKEAREAMGD